MSSLQSFLHVKSPSPAAARRARMSFTQRLRHLNRSAFAGFILYTSVTHSLATTDGATASIDALCPFGRLETLWQYVSSGGQFVAKTHLSNIVIGMGLSFGVVITGGAFCGWVCPFGAMQDALNWVRAKLRIHPLPVSDRIDRVLRCLS